MTSSILRPIRTEAAYIYYPQHCHGIGWALFNDDRRNEGYLTVQRIDEADAFDSDAEAAFHVICAATFDTGPEGIACRDALRKIIAFGECGRNPIATMLRAYTQGQRGM